MPSASNSDRCGCVHSGFCVSSCHKYFANGAHTQTLPRLSLSATIDNTHHAHASDSAPLQASSATQPTMASTPRERPRTGICHARQHGWGHATRAVMVAMLLTSIAPGLGQPTSPTRAPVTPAPSLPPTSFPTFQGCSFPSNIPNGQRIGGSDNAP